MFELTSNDITMHLPRYTVPDDPTIFGRAKLLYDTVRVLPTLGRGEYKSVQRERAGRQANTDSNDEGMLDPPLDHISMQKILGWFRLILIALAKTIKQA